MNLVLTLKSNLTKKYGQAGVQQIDTALQAYVAAAGSSALLYLDSPESMAGFQVAAIPGNNAGAILLAIRSLRVRTGHVLSVLFIGGDDIVPYWQMQNPVTDRGVDVDDVVYTDNPYGSASDDQMSYLVPDLPIGRLADSSTANAAEFVRWIEGMTANRSSRTNRQGSVAIYNEEWVAQSGKVSAALPAPLNSHAAPGYAVSASNSADLNGQYLYFNLHGFDNAPQWMAFDPERGQFVVAVDPSAFNNASISGSVAFAENCYAGLTVSRDATSSCALRLLQQGVAAFVAPSGLAFGSYLDSTTLLENSDFLAASFFRRVAQGLPAGSALAQARQDYVANDPTPSSNVFKQKTLLQFNLLGDPSL
jgi:hypothetical protein